VQLAKAAVAQYISAVAKSYVTDIIGLQTIPQSRKMKKLVSVVCIVGCR